MNFKKMMKRGQEGFTLVELIVVIAILGILGGVAVPAYSGYVEKANMGADQALIGEVMHALSLHHYANPNAGGGVVALSTSGASADDKFGAAAMESAFGADWESVAVLKYDGWAEASGIGNLSGSTIANTDAKEITGAVTGLTNLAAAVIGSNEPSTATAIINTIFGSEGEELVSELRQYESDPNYSTIASNLLVKYFADDIGSAQLSTDENDQFQVDGMNSMSEIAARYAVLFSMANSDSEYSGAAKTKLETFNASLAEISKKEQEDSSTPVQQEILNAFGELISDPTVDANGKTFGDVYEAYITANEGAELAAVIDAMGLVNSISNGFSKDALSDSQMFNSDSMVTLLGDYQAAANNGSIVIRMDATGMVSVTPAAANPINK